jgi:hypothetical protein
MTTQTVNLEDNKYTIIFTDENNIFDFNCLRNGEYWRNLIGDKLVFAMFCEIVNLRQRIETMKEITKKENEQKYYKVKNDDLVCDEAGMKGLLRIRPNLEFVEITKEEFDNFKV